MAFQIKELCVAWHITHKTVLLERTGLASPRIDINTMDNESDRISSMQVDK